MATAAAAATSHARAGFIKRSPADMRRYTEEL
jgi:hypothetical protein